MDSGIICGLMETHTVFVAGGPALEITWKREKIEQVFMLLVSTLSARERVLLKMSVPEERTSDLAEKLPSLHAPTINHLHGGMADHGNRGLQGRRQDP